MMRAELRADGLHIAGYVNVPGRMSRPLSNKKYGQFIETIEQRAFQRAIDRANRIDLLVDHEKDRQVASTADKTLNIWEDEIGLRAEAVISDEKVVESAKNGRLRGWSFDMSRITDGIEERAQSLPVRHVKDFDMSEISLIIDKIPCYNATSVEVRGEDGEEVEIRANQEKVEFTEIKQPENYEEYEKIIKELRGESE